MQDKISLLMERINALKAEKTPVLVALEGGSASGKSTLGAQLAQALDATLVHMDDFFLPLELRTPERFAQPGGNVHWERVKAEVLQPLKEGKPLEYGVFDCSVMAVNRTVRETAKDVSSWRAPMRSILNCGSILISRYSCKSIPRPRRNGFSTATASKCCSGLSRNGSRWNSSILPPAACRTAVT